ncbi:radical SAM protein [Brevundimonas sp.]|uniref:B12-binding domain-containing radical SAM protein n=1 Tax=Brevundimonas sp. TaxID=1871086 RepID=UPI0025B82E12|nr:radical SAM protein [Brevundimonas sp.]
MLAPKKRDHALARRQQYLNYGALTLATQLSAAGTPAILFHGAHDEPEDLVDRLEGLGLLPSRYPVMLSMPSFYALSWTQGFARILRARYPRSRLVIGGRWVTGPDPAWLHGLVPEADVIVPGLGEAVIGGLVGAPAPTALLPAMPDIGLDHRLVEDFLTFQPSIETSRGCGMGCAFCEERDIPLSPLRHPARLADLLAETRAQYGGGEIHPYLQSSFFLPNPRWAARLAEEVAARGVVTPWRCETRVDAMKPETIGHLAAAGLKVIDLGLESASPSQVLAMRKAKDPVRYLRSASELLRACQANGVWVKANVLLYAGETMETIAETQAWLDDHADAIKGVSVGPVVAFGPPSTTGTFVADLEALGARVVDPDSAGRTGITRIHPSATIGAEAAEDISLGLSRRYMDADAYFELKAFSYYPRGYDRQAYDADIYVSAKESLPFRTD